MASTIWPTLDKTSALVLELGGKAAESESAAAASAAGASTAPAGKVVLLAAGDLGNTEPSAAILAGKKAPATPTMSIHMSIHMSRHVPINMSIRVTMRMSSMSIHMSIHISLAADNLTHASSLQPLPGEDAPATPTATHTLCACVHTVYTHAYAYVFAQGCAYAHVYTHVYTHQQLARFLQQYRHSLECHLASVFILMSSRPSINLPSHMRNMRTHR